MTYGDFKDLPRRKASDKVLRDKAFNIAKKPKYHWYQKGLALIVYTFFDKKYSATPARSETLATWNKFSGVGVKNKNMFNQELDEELQKPIVTKL